jgi:lipase (class 3)
MISDYDAASLCRALYMYEGDLRITWDLLSLDNPSGVAYGVKAIDGYDCIAFRGTSNLEDALRDIKAFPIEPAGPYTGIGSVHAGFWEGIPETVDKLLTLNPQGNFFITGHSFGAAHAILFDEALACRSILILDDPILFGEPSSTFKKPETARSWRNGDDPVCTILPWPYRHRQDFIHCDIPAAPDDPWGDWLGRHRIERYQEATLKAQSCSSLAPTPASQGHSPFTMIRKIGSYLSGICQR